MSDHCRQANKKNVLAPVACHELETFYLGDLSAVEKGLGLNGLTRQQGKEKFRNPDILANPAQELKQLTGGKYQKIGGSRLIGPHLNPDVNNSPSFNALIRGVRRLISENGGEAR